MTVTEKHAKAMPGAYLFAGHMRFYLILERGELERYDMCSFQLRPAGAQYGSRNLERSMGMRMCLTYCEVFADEEEVAMFLLGRS